MDSATIKTEFLGFGYTDTPVLRGIDLRFEPGMVHAIVGPNGSGKSTLLDLLSGHRLPTSGIVSINDIPVDAIRPRSLARLCALVPQELDMDFPFTVAETVLMGRHPHIPRFARPNAADRDIVSECTAAMDLGALEHRTLADLSGGERQRTAVARGLAQATPIILLDEPTSSMDIRHALATMTELVRLARAEHRTVITVLHDLNLAAAFCDRIVMLDSGSVHASGTVAETLTPETIETVFKVRATVLETENGPHIAFS